MRRRDFLRGVGVATISALGACAPARLPARAPALQGQQPAISLGVLGVTDMAPLVMAEQLGLYQKHGLTRVQIQREASWAVLRDKLLSGEHQVAQLLASIPLLVYGSEATPARHLHIAMILNANGQALTLSSRLAAQIGYGQLAGAREALLAAARLRNRPLTLAIAFPGAINDLLLRSWLAAVGISPSAVQVVTVPPPQTLARLSIGEIDGFFVAEPWPLLAVKRGIGYTYLTSQDTWQGNPDKCLAISPAFAATHQEELKALMRAVLEACRWLDDPFNRAAAVDVIAGRGYVNMAPNLLRDRFELAPRYELGAGLGERIYPAGEGLRFHGDGAVNAPRRDHALWYLAQMVRFGIIRKPIDYQRVVDEVLLRDLYAEVARDLGIAVPDDDLQPFALAVDDILFDPRDVPGSLQRYAAAIRTSSTS